VSNLKPWLEKRRGRFYEGETLRQMVASFTDMVENGAQVYEFPQAIIVLEEYGLPGNFRGWLLFDKFTRGVVRAMDQVTRDFSGVALYASTHDKRIRDLLLKMGYLQYKEDSNDYWLVKRGITHGM
jgi:hypothetical protein